jgi:hypothetical protein
MQHKSIYSLKFTGIFKPGLINHLSPMSTIPVKSEALVKEVNRNTAMRFILKDRI